ncbi:MAG: hypothetical protein QM820_55505 [Minicystis sp.]
MKQLGWLLAIATAMFGCGGGETLSPVGTEVMDAGTDAAPPAGTVKRTVMERSPLGPPVGNHLFDGDFEFSTVPHAGAQLGARAFSGDGSENRDLAMETGGLCRSGLRCAVMEPSTLLLLRGASANGKGNAASAWAKVPEGAVCSVVRPILINCDTFTINKTLGPTTKQAGPDGWCHYAVSISAQDSATCIYVQSTLKEGQTAILDAFTLGPDDGTVQPLAAEFWVPDAETVIRLENMRARERATMPLGKPPKRAVVKP